jgi:glycyl-tRNA synthetase beta chain
VADLLFELRCEELPPRDLAEAAKSLTESLQTALGAAGLPASSTSAAWTPRRIAVWAHGLADRTPEREERLVGPKLAAAFDAAGKPTKAAEGFAKKAGVAVEALSKDATSVFAMKKTPGRAAAEIVAEVLPTLPAKVKWKKTMRWGGPVPFARPIRGVVALLGGDVVACTVAGLDAGRVTRGHPFLAPRDVSFATASHDEYVRALKDAFVLACPNERREAVLAAARKLVHGLEVREALLLEVTNLVEWPTALVGKFEERFRELPPKLLVTVMEHHQRFFPIRDAKGGVENRFVAILDRDADSIETARHGFERVLTPRLHDASFFFAEDRKTPLASRLPKLADVTYHKKLGSLADKTHRLRKLVDALAGSLGLSEPEARAAFDAATVAKCDLVTLLVGEFPELQGDVGSEYARHEGASAAVSEAIASQYRREFGEGATVSRPALALLLAENLDILCQFGTKVGLPSGSNDPFGVRRAAITLLDACERFAPTFDVVAAIESAGGDATIVEYVDTRLRQRLRDAGYRFDHIDAVTSWRSVGEFRSRLDDLKALASDVAFSRLLEVAERCRNITKKADDSIPPLGKSLPSGMPIEQAQLFDRWSAMRSKVTQPPKPLTRLDVMQIATNIADPLHAFFAKVFVNDDDRVIRESRLSLLKDIDSTLMRFADLCRIQKA